MYRDFLISLPSLSSIPHMEDHTHQLDPCSSHPRAWLKPPQASSSMAQASSSLLEHGSSLLEPCSSLIKPPRAQTVSECFGRGRLQSQNVSEGVERAADGLRMFREGFAQNSRYCFAPLAGRHMCSLLPSDDVVHIFRPVPLRGTLYGGCLIWSHMVTDCTYAGGAAGQLFVSAETDIIGMPVMASTTNNVVR